MRAAATLLKKGSRSLGWADLEVEGGRCSPDDAPDSSKSARKKFAEAGAARVRRERGRSVCRKANVLARLHHRPETRTAIVALQMSGVSLCRPTIRACMVSLVCHDALRSRCQSQKFCPPVKGAGGRVRERAILAHCDSRKGRLKFEWHKTWTGRGVNVRNSLAALDAQSQASGQVVLSLLAQTATRSLCSPRPPAMLRVRLQGRVARRLKLPLVDAHAGWSHCSASAAPLCAGTASCPL